MPTTEPESTNGEALTDTIMPSQSYVGMWNLQSAEFPLIASAMSVYSPIVPLTATALQNGMLSLGAVPNFSNNRTWGRVQVNQPVHANAPLVIETFFLTSNDPEPPVAVSSQYIRVVIRSIIIPGGTKDGV